MMSYLSSNVKDIFIDIFKENKAELFSSSNTKTFQMLLDNFDKDSVFLMKNDLQFMQEYRIAIKLFCNFFHETTQLQFTQLEIEYYSHQISKWLTSANESQIQNWFQMTSSEAKRHLHLLQITSAVEFGLGNFYLLKQRPCPFLLRDLIQSEELREMFGTKIMKFLTLLFGGPLSLNLRNLLWHGFVSEDELHNLYQSSMVFVLVYLSKSISEQNLMPRTKVRSLVNKKAKIQLLTNHFKEKKLLQKNMLELQALFLQSPFISSSVFFLFQSVLELFFAQRYGDCAQVLLPRIESLLRQQYAWSNKCPDRILTAESTEFYTTIDEILKETLTNGHPNVLLQVIDKHILVLIMDLFVLMDGLRLRDHLSHGEMSSCDVDEKLAFVLIILAVLLSHENPSINKEKLEIEPTCNKFCICRDSELYQSFYDVIMTYHPMFHPLSLAKRDALFCLRACLNETASLDCVNSSLQNDERHFEQLCNRLNAIASRYLEPFFDSKLDSTDCIEVFDKIQLEILNRSHANNVTIRQISAQMRRMQANINENLKQKIALYRARKMRSRQRKNFQRLVESLPVLTTAMKLISFVVLSLVHRTKVLDKFPFRKLKSTLKICENCANSSCLDVNKWDDCVALITKLLENLS